MTTDPKILRVVQHQQDLVHITWMINNICQNKCTYCVPELNSGKGHHYKWEDASKFVDLLFEKYSLMHFSVTGGEPSLCSFFPDLVKKITDTDKHTIGLTTNGYASVDYWKKISQSVSYICFSYHPEYPTEEFLEKVLYSAMNTVVTVRVMMHPRYWEHSLKVYEDIKDLPSIFVEPVRVVDWGQKDRSIFVYNEEQLEWFARKETSQKGGFDAPEANFSKFVDLRSDFVMSNGDVKGANALDFVNSGETNFKGYVCEVGLKSLFVEHTGDIFLGNCCIGGVQGNLNDPDNIKWPTKRVICTKSICHCASDICLNKWTRDYFKDES